MIERGLEFLRRPEVLKVPRVRAISGLFLEEIVNPIGHELQMLHPALRHRSGFAKSPHSRKPLTDTKGEGAFASAVDSRNQIRWLLHPALHRRRCRRANARTVRCGARRNIGLGGEGDCDVLPEVLGSLCIRNSGSFRVRNDTGAVLVGGLGSAKMPGRRGSAPTPKSPKKAGPRSFLAGIPQNFSSFVTCVNPRLSGFRQNGAVAGKPPMFDGQTTALLRAFFDEVCEAVSRYGTSARTHVASMILRPPATARPR
jgi:hypothetical protein